MEEHSKDFLTGVLFIVVFTILAGVLVLCCPSCSFESRDSSSPNTQNDSDDLLTDWLHLNPW